MEREIKRARKSDAGNGDSAREAYTNAVLSIKHAMGDRVIRRTLTSVDNNGLRISGLEEFIYVPAYVQFGAETLRILTSFAQKEKVQEVMVTRNIFKVESILSSI